MTKIWLIAKQQFLKEARKRSFILVILSLPLFMSVSIGVGYLASRMENRQTTIGYVDEANFLQSTTLPGDDANIELIRFDTVEGAHAALDQGEIEAYYHLPQDYESTREADMVYAEYPEYPAQRYFWNLTRLNMLAGESSDVIELALSRVNVIIVDSQSSREYPNGDPNPGQVLSLIIALMFGFLIMTTSAYMMSVVVEEKENRTMEVVITSVSPYQLMVGKTLGAIGISVIQLVVWLLFLTLSVWVGKDVLAFTWLQDLSIDWRDVGLISLVAAPTYLCISAIMTAVGATMVEEQEMQQVGPLIFIGTFLPIYLIYPIFQDPNGPVAIVFSMIPLTTLLTFAMRGMIMQVPAWQYLAATSLSMVLGLLALWLAGKAFRLNMLRYGQAIRLRDIFKFRRSRTNPGEPARA